MARKPSRCYVGKQPSYLLIGTILATIITLCMVLTAFWTPSWLVAELDVTPEKITAFGLPLHKIGVWEVCMRVYQLGNPYNRYAIICETHLSLSHDSQFYFPAYIIACEVMFTLAVVLCAAASIVLVVVIICGTHRTLLAVIGALYIVAGILVALTVVIFAACAFGKNGMFFQEPKYVFLSWSFWLAVGGSPLLVLCGVGYFVERYFCVHQSRNLITRVVM